MNINRLSASFAILTLLYICSPVLCSVGHHDNFRFILKAGGKQCFGQDIAKETLVSYMVSPEDESITQLDFVLMGPDGEVIKKEEKKNKFQLMRVSKDSGIYKICVISHEVKEVKIFFHLVQDAGLDMLESVFSDLELPALGEMINLGMKADHILKLAQSISAVEMENFQLSDMVIKSLPYFSGLFLIILVAVMCVQTYYLKRFFMEKKLV